MRILVIDNDKVFTEPVIWRLKKEGHEVVFVTSVEETRAVMQSSFDVAVLDIMMPRGPYSKVQSDSGRRTGACLLDEIESQWPQLPVVILTVRPDEGLRRELEAHTSVKAYLVKPATPTEVVSAIAVAVGRDQTNEVM